MTINDSGPRATKVLANKIILTLLTQMTTMMVVKLQGFSLVHSLLEQYIEKNVVLFWSITIIGSYRYRQLQGFPV